MASSSETAAEKVPRWAVGPTEDVVQALMEALVDHLLPLGVTSELPSEDVQLAVAKQMHAVVLLYNYYHKKQKPELVFLEFVNFCKLAVVIRPPLIAFMKMMKTSKPEELIVAENCLSVTENAIRDACDIALGLDASRDVPNIEGWPVSKVSVLLIDSEKENCVLQFGGVTEGVWSLIEKDLNEFTSIKEISGGKKVGTKRKRDNLKLSTYNTDFLKLGYDTIKDVTGISSSELEVLETHITYSLSKEESAACFFIMQCSGSLNEHKQVPLKCFLESVQGPLAEKLTNGLWKATPAVKSYCLLPYLELILCWLSRCGMKLNSSDKKTSENCYSNNKCDNSSHGQVASPVDSFQSTEKEGNLSNKFVKGFEILDSAENSRNRILENLAVGGEKPGKGLSSSSLKDVREMVVRSGSTMDIFEKGCHLANSGRQMAGGISLDDVGNGSGQYRQFPGKTEYDNARERFNEKHDVENPAEMDERRGCSEISGTNRVGCGKDILTDLPMVLSTTHADDLTNICTDGKDDSMLNQNLRVYHYRRKKNLSMKNTEQLREAVPDFKVELDSLKSKHTQRSDEKVSEDMGYLTNTCNITDIASIGNQRAQLETEIKCNEEVQKTLDPSSFFHIRSRDEKIYEDSKGDIIHECNQTCSAAAGNQLAQMEVDSLKPNHTHKIVEKVSVDNSYLTTTCNQVVPAATENQLALVEVEFKHDLGAQTMSASEGLQLEAKFKHSLGAQTTSPSDLQVEANFKYNLRARTISASDQMQNALALLYPKRRELYSKICNIEDDLAFCEDIVARIRDGGEVDLARQCIKSVIGGKLQVLLENGTQIQDNDDQQNENNCKSQHGKHKKLSESYLPGTSSCQDLEYTCLRNDWRLPRYRIESSDGKFMSHVVVEGKDFKLHARGGFESKPCYARETAAAEMIAVMHNTFT